MDQLLKKPLCEECGAIVKGDVCLRCGKVFSMTKDVSTSVQKLVEDHDSVRSIFIKDKGESSVNRIGNGSRKGEIIMVLFLFFLFAGLSGYLYFSLFLNKTGYRSPLFLEAQAMETNNSTISSIEGVPTKAASLSSSVKSIEYDFDLSQGNFSKYNMSVFAAAEENTFIEMFGLRKFIEKFVDKDKFSQLKTDLKIKDDSDLDVYFSDKFALIFPEQNTEKWGMVIYVKDKAFVEEKMKIFDEKFKTESKSKAKIPDNKIKYTGHFAKIAQYKPEDASSDENYLLISNSKEFLDRMKELSEGNLPNLYNTAVYSQAREDFAGIGLLRAYVGSKSKGSWAGFVNWFSGKYDYSGLKEIIMSLDASNLVIYKVSENSDTVKISSEGF